MNIKSLFTGLFALAALSPALAQTPDTAKINRYLDRLAEKNQAMGSLCIAKDGKIQYLRSIGYNSTGAAGKILSTDASRYRIGSITKMFTAVIILQLAEEGKLKLDDTLDKFLPQIPNAPKITIEQILGHRSGIPNVRRPQQAENANTLPMQKDEMIALIVKAAPEFSEPGTRHSYSNSGFYLLGLVIEKVTGRSYEENLRQRITSKIALQDTYMATGNIDVKKNEALTYMNLGGDWKQLPETHPSILFSAGAIISTPQDMVQFIQSLFDGRLVSKEHLDQMKTIRDGDGLGMEPFTFAGKTFYGHSGGADNYGSWLAYNPEEKLAVAYTTNAKVFPVKNIVSGTVDIYYNNPFQIPAFESVAISPEILDKYVGIYTSPDAPVKFTITRKDATLFIQPGTEKNAPLEATAQDKFKIGGAVVEFDASKNQMTLKRGGGQRVFTKEN